jgi:starch phosphorylase
LDGWWAEAYCPEAGWALGDGREHDDDPGWDAQEAEQLYRILEEEVVPAFYDRGPDDIPRAWVARMRESMGALTPRFSTNRMLREYVENLYLPSAQAYRSRSVGGARKASLISRWKESVKMNWQKLRFGHLGIREQGDRYLFEVSVYLEGVEPEAVAVQLYEEAQEGGVPEIHSMERSGAPGSEGKEALYKVLIPAKRPASDYTPRLIPALAEAAVPLEAQQIHWYG